MIMVALAESCRIVAQAEAVFQESWLSWFIRTSGLVGILTLLAGAVAFFGVCTLAFRVRRPATITSYLILLSLPVVVGFLGAAARCVLMPSGGLKGHENMEALQIAGTISDASRILVDAVLASVPAGIVMAVSLFVRASRSSRRHARTNAQIAEEKSPE